MRNPRIGISYDEAVKRTKRILRNPGHPQAKANLIASIANQCRLAEGDPSISELERECAISKQGLAFTGGGNKQTGIGSGHKLGDGKWRFEDGKWIQIY